jgi:hypothetical protein
MANDWLHVNPDHGDGDGSFSVTADANDNIASRSADIVVLQPDTLEYKIVSVQQAGATPYISTDPSSVTIPVTGAPGVDVTVSSNVEWIIHGKDDWIDLSRYGNLLVLSAEANSGAQRGGQVIVSAPSMYPAATIAVMQAGQTEHITVNPATINVGPEYSLNIPITVDSFPAWSVSSDPDWIDYIKHNANTLYLAVHANEGEARDGIVTVTNGVESVDVEVHQSAVSGELFTLYADGSVSDSAALNPVNLPMYDYGGDFWMFDSQDVTAGLELEPVSADVRYNSMVIEIDLNNVSVGGDGAIFLVPLWDDAYLELDFEFDVEQSWFRALYIEGSTQVDMQGCPFTSGTGAFTITLGQVSGTLSLSVQNNVLYSRQMKGHWTIESSLPRHLFVGKNPGSGPGMFYPVLGAKLYRVEVALI